VVDVEFLIGVDIGTLGSKGVIIDSEGRVLAQHFVEHGINIPRPGWAEQNPEDYWNEFKVIVRNLLIKSNVSPDKIAGIGISSLSPDACPVDKEGKPVRSALIYMDRRAVEECDLVRGEFGEEEILKITGNAIDPYFSGYKMLWIMRNEPEIYRKTWKFLNACKYVVLKLTGVPSVDLSNAVLAAPFFNFLKRKWSDDVISRLGFDAEKLPEVFDLGKVIGEITRSTASETGLIAGTPIVSCAPDAMMSFYSVGATEVGDSVFMIGTTGCWGVITPKPVFDPRLINGYYVGEDSKYISVAGMATTGALVRWFRDEFGILERDVERLAGVSAYSLLDREAEKVPPGSDGLIVLPYFMGERTPIWDPRARGVIFGLTLYHTRAHIFRAILESAGYALRQHVEIVRELGIDIRRLIAVNGGAKSRLWRQIISDITGLPQQYVPEAPGAPYGDAFLAGVATGIFKNPTQIRDYVKIAEETRPNKENAAIYEKLYKIYLTLYPALKNQMHNL